jgi:sialic acid synthase SpsE
VLLGDGAKEHRPNEAEIGPRVRRSIVAARDLPAGHVLTWDDLSWVRPGGGLAPGQEHALLGKRLAAPLAPGEKILPDSLIGQQ